MEGNINFQDYNNQNQRKILIKPGVTQPPAQANLTNQSALSRSGNATQ